MSSAGKSVMLGTAGHVDHGKTALVKLLTGCETDTLAVEKQRGLTIELGFAPCRMADERILGIIDVPGHVDFIRNMAAGAHGIDVVILVIAADDGIMPQTREHLDILTLMGVSHGLVALTKIDLVDEELRQMVVEEVSGFLRGTFLEDAPVCPISNITGAGFDGFFTALNQAVDSAQAHEDEGLFRLWIERSFHVRGFGTVVSGIPSRGRVRVGDRLRLVPGNQAGRIRGMEVYGQASKIGRVGQCVALNISDIDVAHLSRGRVLCQGDACEPVTMVEAELTLLGGVPHPVKDYIEGHVHVGTAEVMGNVALLERQTIGPAESQFVQLRLREPLGMAPGERFVIRSSVSGLAGGRVTTIGGGRILGTGNTRLRRRRPWTIDMLKQRKEALDSPAAWCALCLKEAGEPMSGEHLARRAQVPTGRIETLLAAALTEGAVLALDSGEFLHRETIEKTEHVIIERVNRFHDANPMRLGIAEAQLVAETGPDRQVFDAALARLIDSGSLRRSGVVVASPDKTAAVSPEDRRLFERIDAALQAAHLAPPSAEALAENLGEPVDRVNEMIRLLVDAGTVLRLDRKVAMHRDAVEAAEAVVVDLFSKANSFETVQFRDALGVSRKYAVPLLDYFDTVKLTVRSASRRKPGARARELLGRS